MVDSSDIPDHVSVLLSEASRRLEQHTDAMDAEDDALLDQFVADLDEIVPDEESAASADIANQPLPHKYSGAFSKPLWTGQSSNLGKLWPCAEAYSPDCQPIVPSYHALMFMHSHQKHLVESLEAFLFFIDDHDSMRSAFMKKDRDYDEVLSQAAIAFGCIRSLVAGQATPKFDYFEIHRSSNPEEHEWQFKRAKEGVADEEDLKEMITEDVKCAGCGAVHAVSVLYRGKDAEAIARGQQPRPAVSESEARRGSESTGASAMPSSNVSPTKGTKPKPFTGRFQKLPQNVPFQTFAQGSGSEDDMEIDDDTEHDGDIEDATGSSKEGSPKGSPLKAKEQAEMNGDEFDDDDYFESDDEETPKATKVMKMEMQAVEQREAQQKE